MPRRTHAGSRRRGSRSEYPAPDFVDRVRHERERMAERVEALTQKLRAIDDYLDAVDGTAAS